MVPPVADGGGAVAAVDGGGGAPSLLGVRVRRATASPLYDDCWEGRDRCMGDRLGEMQLHIVWEEILKRYSDVELVGNSKRVLSNFVRGIEYMPVVLHK